MLLGPYQTPVCFVMAAFIGIGVLVIAGRAAAMFPDCVNGPLANNTVCDTSASQDALTTITSFRIQLMIMKALLIELPHLLAFSRSRKRSTTQAIHPQAFLDLACLLISGGKRPCMVLRLHQESISRSPGIIATLHRFHSPFSWERHLTTPLSRMWLLLSARKPEPSTMPIERGWTSGHLISIHLETPVGVEAKVCSARFIYLEVAKS